MAHMLKINTDHIEIWAHSNKKEEETEKPIKGHI